MSTRGLTADFKKPFGTRYQFGIRLGGWANLGDTPPASDSTGNFTSDIGDGSAYVEGFVGWRLSRRVYLETDFGVVNRGSVTLVENNEQYIGNLMISPLLVQLKFYPLAGDNAKLLPFLSAGGGIYIGKRSVQFTTDSYASLYGSFNDNSQTEFNAVFGGGFHYRVANTLALELSGRYMPIHFNDLAFIDNYTAMTITFGVTYLYNPSKKIPPQGGHHESWH